MRDIFSENVVGYLYNIVYDRVFTADNPDDINNSIIDELFEHPLAIDIPKKESDAHILSVQIKKAEKNGDIKCVDTSEEIKNAFGAYVFDFTDKGKRLYLPLILKKVREKIEIVLDKMEKVFSDV
jgi:hypothetical protein